MNPDAEKWNQLYKNGGPGQLQAASVLEDNRHLLPETGKALDLACGRGANAMLLARHGLETHAWDISSEAIRLLETSSRQSDIQVHCAQRDVVAEPPAAESYDVIVVSRFLERKLIPHLITALRPQGLIYYQTFTREPVDDTGPSNPDYRLDANELLIMFSRLRILLYREEGRIGDITRGFRNEAMLIARKS